MTRHAIGADRKTICTPGNFGHIHTTQRNTQRFQGEFRGRLRHFVAEREQILILIESGEQSGQEGVLPLMPQRKRWRLGYLQVSGWENRTEFLRRCPQLPGWRAPCAE